MLLSALRNIGRYDEAIVFGRQACQFADAGFLAHMLLAASLAEAQRNDEAQAAIAKAMQLEPSLSISFCRDHFVGQHETSSKRLLDSLHKAGVPEE
jgi:adenylate cyclase